MIQKIKQLMPHFEIKKISTVDVAASVLAVALAISLAHALKFEYATWAAFSAYVVMRPLFIQTFKRGVLRILGTLLGGISGTLFALFFQNELSLITVCNLFFIVNCITAYCTNTASNEYNYAILFFGLTFTLIVGYAFIYPAQNITHIGIMRASDVTIGSISTIIISGLICSIFKRNKISSTTMTSESKIDIPIGMQTENTQKANYIPFSLLAGLSISLTPLTTLFTHSAMFIQAAVTILAVSNQPRTVTSANLPAATITKLYYRAIGCLLGASIGIIFNIISVYFSSYLLLMVLTLIGTAIGKVVQDSSAESSYIGTQFSVGLLMVCVHNSASFMNDHYGIYRFLGVLTGFMIYLPMLMLFNLYLKKRSQR
ncbi:MAG: FUSC family protein [Plesiomonas sp.]|uniref:FUSC family protein n=1 Tax=Plesiomonas sp. TaxID=2486279 RepID=UPI003F3052F5